MSSEISAIEAEIKEYKLQVCLNPILKTKYKC